VTTHNNYVALHHKHSAGAQSACAANNHYGGHLDHIDNCTVQGFEACWYSYTLYMAFMLLLHHSTFEWVNNFVMSS